MIFNFVNKPTVFLLQDRALQCVMRVILSFKSNEIENTVKSLEQTQSDVLMKYIYRGFEFPSDGSSAHLLTWHEQVSNMFDSLNYYSNI